MFRAIVGATSELAIGASTYPRAPSRRRTRSRVQRACLSLVGRASKYETAAAARAALPERRSFT